jgi:hypothetical protein
MTEKHNEEILKLRKRIFYNARNWGNSGEIILRHFDEALSLLEKEHEKEIAEHDIVFKDIQEMLGEAYLEIDELQAQKEKIKEVQDKLKEEIGSYVLLEPRMQKIRNSILNDVDKIFSEAFGENNSHQGKSETSELGDAPSLGHNTSGQTNYDKNDVKKLDYDFKPKKKEGCGKKIQFEGINTNCCVKVWNKKVLKDIILCPKCQKKKEVGK